MVENQESSSQVEQNTAPEQAETGLTLGETTSESVAEENTVDSTESTESVENDNSEDTSDADAESESDSKKSGKGFEKRIERFNRRLSEKDAEIEHWRKVALQNANGNQTQQPAAKPQVTLEKPKFSDYNDLEAYTDAMTDWKLEQREFAKRQQEIVQTFQQREQAIRAKDPEYDEVIADFKDRYKHVNAPEINQYIAESDKGPELFYYLANNTAEVDRILGLSPLKQVAELGKLEAKLSSVGSETKPANRVSKAPPPVTKEKGQAPAVKRLEDPNLSQAEYRQLRMQNKRRY